MGFGGAAKYDNYPPGYGGGGKKILPTLGVSFGLPYAGGYPINPLGQPHAPNPYFGAIGPDGLNLGLLNVNPLVSLQVTKNEHGEKLVKPLVNLHVTPNAGIIKAVGSLFLSKKQGLHNHYHHHLHRYPPPPPIHYPGEFGHFDNHHGPPTGPGFHGPTGPGFHGPEFHGPTGPGFHGPEFHSPTGPGFHGPEFQHPPQFAPDFHGPPTGPGFQHPPSFGPDFHGPPTGPGNYHGPSIADRPIFGPPIGFKDNSPVDQGYDNFAADFNPELNSFRSINASVDEQQLQLLKRNYNYQSLYPQNENKFKFEDKNSQQTAKGYANNYKNYNSINNQIPNNYNRFVTIPTQAPGSARGSKTVTFPNNRRKRDTDQIVPDSIDSESNIKETLDSVHDTDGDKSEGRAIIAGKVRT